MDRRTFLFTSSGAAAGLLVVSGLSDADEGPASKLSESGLVTGKPKPLRHKAVPGFLSAEQIAPHHTAHYGGALKAFVRAEEQLEESFTGGEPVDAAAFETLKRMQSSRGNSVVLHELYFDGLALESASPGENLRGAIEKRFGSMDRWGADFIASAKAAAGWAMLVIHPVNGRLYNVVSDEHAQFCRSGCA